ncbi:MAG TPA: outer membrane beta-barrel protein [Pyrinomonadaceae bacterium]|nr:outer membrane beta-barrel protein [Pyrinomonadaceae bacterium]
MKKILTYSAFFAIVALAGVSTYAQNEFRRWEGYAGYQALSVSTGLGELNDEIGEEIFENRRTAHGFNGSVTGNLTRLVGLKFDYSSHNTTLFEDPGFVKIRYRNQQFLGGVQIKNNDVDGPTFKPWGHILAGLANQKIRCEGADCDLTINPPPPSGTVFEETNNSFSMVFGGGLDIKVHPRVDIRAIQFDYNPIFFGGSQEFDLSDRTQNNWRIGFGIVFH